MGLNSWTGGVAALPNGQTYGQSGFAVDQQGRAYLLGGWAGPATANRFDPATGAWTSLPNIPAAAVLSGQRLAVTDVANRVWLFGNVSVAAWRAYYYDVNTNLWQTGPADLATSAYQLRFAVADRQGRIYVVGTPSSGASQLWRLDTTTQTWTRLADLPSTLTFGGGDRLSGFVDPDGAPHFLLATKSGTATLHIVYRSVTDDYIAKAAPPHYDGPATCDDLGRFVGLDTGSSTLTPHRWRASTDSWETLPTATLTGINWSTGYAATLADGDLYVWNDGYGAQTGLHAYFNAPPAAPAGLAPDGTTVDRTILQRLSWTFTDPDEGDTQTRFTLRYRPVGTTTWTSIDQSVTTTFWDAPAGTFTDDTTYEWQVATYDHRGTIGRYSGSAFLTAQTAPSPPTILAPVSGGTVSIAVPVTWSTPVQESYQVRRVADDAEGGPGTPDPGTVYFDTGEIVAAATRSQPLFFPVNDRWEHIQVRIKADGLWSTWADVRVRVDWTPPPAPTFTVSAQPDTASLLVSITNPASTGSQPEVARNEVWVNDGNGMERRVFDVPKNEQWTYRTPISGYDYVGNLMVVAVATNGETARQILTDH